MMIIHAVVWNYVHVKNFAVNVANYIVPIVHAQKNVQEQLTIFCVTSVGIQKRIVSVPLKKDHVYPTK